MCEFRIGQKVVCVDANPRWGGTWGSSDSLVKGSIYTVTGIMTSSFPQFCPFDLLFAEIRRRGEALTQKRPAFGYGCDRFRPLVTDDSRYDISVFLRICSDATSSGFANGSLQQSAESKNSSDARSPR